MNTFAMYLGYAVMMLSGCIATGLLGVYVFDLLVRRLSDSVGGYFEFTRIIYKHNKQKQAQSQTAKE